jgi:uncharacterized membrane protein
MAFCVKCGAALNQQAGFCGSCGKPVGATSQAPDAPPPTGNPGNSPAGWAQVAAPATPSPVASPRDGWTPVAAPPPPSSVGEQAGFTPSSPQPIPTPATAPRDGWTPIAAPPPPASAGGQAGFTPSAAQPLPTPATAPREGWTQVGSQPLAATSSTQGSYVPPGGQPASVPIVPPAVATALSPNVAAALSYALGFITGAIFLSLEPYKQSRFVRFHAMQSILYCAVCIVFSIAWRVFFGILMQFSPWTAFALVPLRLLISLGFFLLWLYLMYQAYNQREFRIPIIGAIAAKQAG